MHISQSGFEDSLTDNVILAPFTTLGIGGPARFFAEAKSAEDLAEGVSWARARGIPLFVLGGGSNIVVSDDGFPGLVLRVSLRGVTTRVEDDIVFVTASAGEDWDSLVAFCVNNNWAGVECLSGIPGLVGATPVQNVGAYGQDVSESFVSLEALDLTDDNAVTIGAGECRFGYRTSRFKTADRERFIITRVTYRLIANGRPALRYPELRRYLTDQGTGNLDNLALKDVREAVLAIRKRKAMVIDAADPDSRSVGSFFVNPVVTVDEFDRIKTRALRISQDIPAFPVDRGMIKLSAAWLIEQSGIKRGQSFGGVGVSTRHSLAIINRGSGTAREVVALAEEMKSRVRDAFGVELIPEPVFVGFSA